jgi:very-short-patch-repair endonuclease
MKNIITESVRILRKNPTRAEELLWEYIRDKQLGKKFLRQKPIIIILNNHKRFIVADFYCREARLIIELDGSIHEQYKDYDNSRDEIAERYGYRVIRFTNDEVINNIHNVVMKINNVINKD